MSDGNFEDDGMEAGRETYTVLQAVTEDETPPPPSAKGQKKRKLKTAKRGPGQAPWAPFLDTSDTRSGFAKLTNQTLRTMDERQYEEILTDEEKWPALKARMETDFDHELEMFPFAEREEDIYVNPRNLVEMMSAGIGKFLKDAAFALHLVRIPLPRRYYTITRMDIEERFPGGRASGEPGDGDIRDLLSAFRHLFRENLATFIGKKRWFQFNALTAFFLSIAGLLLLRRFIADQLSKLPDSLTRLVNPEVVTPVLLCGLLVLAYAVTYYFFRRESNTLHTLYLGSQTESCKTLDKQAALRTKQLSVLITAMAARIDQDEEKLARSNRAKDWPEFAYRWMLTVYWMGRRLEYLERYTQMQIWLIRRAHYFYRLVASVTCHMVTAVGVAGIAFVSFVIGLAYYPWRKVTGCKAYLPQVPDWLSKAVETGQKWLHMSAASSGDGVQAAGIAHPDLGQCLAVLEPGTLPDWLFLGACLFGLALAVHFLFLIGYKSKNEWNTQLDLVEKNLDVRNWNRYHSVHLHRVLAEQVSRDKGKLLQWETRFGGRPR